MRLVKGSLTISSLTSSAKLSLVGIEISSSIMPSVFVSFISLPSDFCSSMFEFIYMPFKKQILHQVLIAPFSSWKLRANSFLKSSCHVIIVSPCRENSCSLPMKLLWRITCFILLSYSASSLTPFGIPSYYYSSLQSTGSARMLTSSFNCYATRVSSSILSSETIWM